MINPVNYNVISFTAKKQTKHEPINEAVSIHRRLTNNGFYDSPNNSSRFKYLYSEIDEFKQAVKNNDRENMKEEIGDVIFDAVLLADYYDIDPTAALNQANKKMSSRLNLVDMYAKKPLLEYTFEERMQFWEKAKNTLRLTESN